MIPSLALLTDLYQLTMAEAYWKLGRHNKIAAFDLFYRENPFQGGYAICSGLENVVNFINHYGFKSEELEYLDSLKTVNSEPLFVPEFLDYLAELKLTLDVNAMIEGTVVFPQEPLVQVIGPLLQCQLLESTLLNLINFPTLIATKASRVCFAAHKDPVVEFGLRRAQGVDGALTATRSAFVGGVHATSNVLAGYQYGIPIRGTHAHSWIMAFDNEYEAFKNYAEAFPNNSLFLVDTYSTVEGVRNAIKVGQELKTLGYPFIGIRLDSGDLCSLSISARTLLDEAGFKDAIIMASGDLDEYEIQRLKHLGCKINIWGVGTRLVTGYDQSALGGVYKLVAIQNEKGQWQNKAKKSDDIKKNTLPGILNVKRFEQEGVFVKDILFDVNAKEVNAKNEVSILSETLLKPIFRKGELLYKLPTLNEIQQYSKMQLKKLPEEYRRLNPKSIYPVIQEK